MDRLFRAGALAALALACPVHAEPVTVDLLLGLEAFGSLRTDPLGRWVAVERLRSAADLPRHDLNASAYADLYVGDLRHGGLEPLLAQEPDVGVTLGDVAPGGARLAVQRLQGDRLRLGVVDVGARAALWTDVAPLPAVWGRSMEWASERTLLVLGTADGDLPARFAPAAATVRRLTDRWGAAADGRPSFVVNETAAAGPTAAPGDDVVLWSLDALTGVATPLARGPFIDLELSYDGRIAAVTLDAPVERPPGGAVDEARRRRSLLLVDVETGAAVRPAGADDIAATLLAWSPLTRDLLVYSRREEAFLRISADGRSRRLDLGGLAPSVPLTDGVGYQPQGGWLAGDPIVLARQPGSGRPGWWRIGPGEPRRLDLGSSVPGRLTALSRDRIAIDTDGDTWIVDRRGRVRRAGPSATIAPPAGVRGLTGPMKAGAAWVRRGDRLCDALSTQPQPCARGPVEDAVAANARAGVSLRIEPGPDGARRLIRTSPARRDELLMALNPELADVRYAAARRISAPGASGWLYLPEGDGPFAVIVIPYPDRVFVRPPAEMRPGARSAVRSGQVLVSAGYAVIYPDLPHRDDPGDQLADRILSVVDAAAETAPIDRSRVGLWGWSFGAWASALSAAQSDRVGAVVALNGVYDPLSALGSISLAGRTDGQMRFFATDGARWLESGQARLEHPYWDDPERYRRHSVVAQAPRIRAPILLMTGDLDLGIGQSELLFSALNRLDRPAALITFFGEDHGLVSPGNLRQMYARTIDWFDRHLRADGSGTASVIASGDTRPPSAPD